MSGVECEITVNKMYAKIVRISKIVFEGGHLLKLTIRMRVIKVNAVHQACMTTCRDSHELSHF